MTDYLLDTNHISPLVTTGHPLRQRILDSLQAGNRFAIAVPALTEVLFGMGLLPRARQNLIIWETVKDKFDYYGIEPQDAEQAAKLQISLRQRGAQLATVDALIAAVALRYDLTLLTGDKDFAAITGLKHENWLRPPSL